MGANRAGVILVSWLASGSQMSDCNSCDRKRFKHPERHRRGVQPHQHANSLPPLQHPSTQCLSLDYPCHLTTRQDVQDRPRRILCRAGPRSSCQTPSHVGGPALPTLPSPASQAWSTMREGRRRAHAFSQSQLFLNISGLGYRPNNVHTLSLSIKTVATADHSSVRLAYHFSICPAF